MIISNGVRKGTVKIHKGCSECFQVTSIEVFYTDLVKHLEGGLVSDVFHYLTEGERELLISGICGKCFDDVFEGFEDDE